MVREIGWYRLHPTGRRSRIACAAISMAASTCSSGTRIRSTAPGAVHLASTPTCPNQAFRFGERAYGLQFHLEADEQLIQRWLHVPEYRAETEAAGPAHHFENILRDTHGHAPATRELSARVFGDFVEMFSWRTKVRLGSL